MPDQTQSGVQVQPNAVQTPAENPAVSQQNGQAAVVAAPVGTQPVAAIQQPQVAQPQPVSQPATVLPTAVPTGIPVGAPTAEAKPAEAKKGFLQSLKDQWAGHVEKNKAQAEKSKAGEVAGQAISETVVSGEKITPQEREEILQAEKVFQEGLASIRDLISPSSMHVEFDKIKISGMYAKTLVIFSYPRYMDTNWMSPLINFDGTMDISQFV